MQGILFLVLVHSVLYSHNLVEGLAARSSQPTYLLVYNDITSFSSCFRRFNGTHSIGCTSSMSGDVGVIHYIDSKDSLEWLLQNGKNKPYIPLMTAKMFTEDSVNQLMKKEGLISGIMVTFVQTNDTASYPAGFSSDLTCPNQFSSIYYNDKEYSCKKHQFNSEGNGFMFRDFNMPVVLLKNQTEIDKIMKCYNAHNVAKDGAEPAFPLCSAELKAFMHGAGNSEICLRRTKMFPRNLNWNSYCSKLGGMSSHAFLAPVIKPDIHKKTIVVTVPSDSISLFEYAQPGASSPVPALATFFAIAEALSKIKQPIIEAGYNVLFMALTGESFDYIGSQKIVYDMEKGYFPNSTHTLTRMKLSDIHIIIELSQFLFASEIFIHSDPNTRGDHTAIKNFTDVLLTKTRFKNAESSQPLPPSSAQMFIREVEKGVPAIVLGDYNEEFKAKFYHGYLDTPYSPGYPPRYQINASLSLIATDLIQTIYSYTTGTTTIAEADLGTIDSILYCMLVNSKCDLFFKVLNPNLTSTLNRTTAPFPFYVNVYSYPSTIDNIQAMIRQLLAFYTGENITATEAECVATGSDSPYLTYWMNGELDAESGKYKNVCIKSTAQYHNATSPAFEMKDYDFTSRKYSTWTESIWPNDAFRARIFLKPSSEVELASMIAGITIFISSAVATVLIQRRSAILFPPHSGEATAIIDAT